MPNSAMLVLAAACGSVANSLVSPLLAPFSILLLAGNRGASGDVVRIMQRWGWVSSCVHISLLYLSIILECNNISYLNITSISFSFCGDGGENNFVFCIGT